jgi:hypothetical protein
MTAASSVAGIETDLLIPHNDEPAPLLSIVIPALNEELTIADFVAWCKQGLREAGVRGEILIIDSSADATSAIALEHGARVLRTPKRGLGRAYIDAIPFIRGKYVLMGDADCTYDFRLLSPFVQAFEQGNDFVMGSRFRGYIEPRSMPPLHRYLGTPVTTQILNVIYQTRFSDIHCGMRGLTYRALVDMDLVSQSWEYASEMVLKSVQMKLRTAEVPVRFLRDKEGRLSHHKRSGWLSPWKAAWINLRAMFVNGADFFLIRPGVAMMIPGAALVLATSAGPVALGPVTLSLYWSLFGLAMAIAGLHSVLLGTLARLLYDRTGRAAAELPARFNYNWSFLISAEVLVVGVGFTTPLIYLYFKYGYQLPPSFAVPNHLAVTGLMLIVFAVMFFPFVLVLHALAGRVSQNSRPASLNTGLAELARSIGGSRAYAEQTETAASVYR